MGKKYGVKERFVEDAPPPGTRGERALDNALHLLSSVAHVWAFGKPMPTKHPTCGKYPPTHWVAGDSYPEIILMPRRTVMLWNEIYEVRPSGEESGYRDGTAAAVQRADAAWREYQEAERAAINLTSHFDKRYVPIKMPIRYSWKALVLVSALSSLVGTIVTRLWLG